MILEKDIGYDQLDDSLFRNIIMVRDTGATFCHVFGSTVEECEENSNNLIYAYNTSTIIKEEREKYLENELAKYRNIRTSTGQ